MQRSRTRSPSGWRPILLTGGLLCLPLHPGAGFAAAGSAAHADAQLYAAHSTGVALAFMLSVTAIKITAFVIGYLIVKLGHDTLLRGVTGEVDFGFSGSGVKAKLKAASPGGLFVLAGAAIIVWGLVVDKPMRVTLTPGVGPVQPETATPSPAPRPVPD